MDNSVIQDNIQLILVFDIGNTNIKAAVGEKDNIIKEWRISTDTKRTGDEYFSILKTLFREDNINAALITKTVLSSVVPVLIGPFVNLSVKLTGKKPVIVGPDLYSRLPVTLPATAVYELGTDLYCDIFEAWSKYKAPCIVADFGTALSFISINGDGHVAGVAIAPGIKTAFKSLFNNTAQIPDIPLDIPQTSLGKNTIGAVQSGIILGYKGLVESLIFRMKDDMAKECNINTSDIKVIATGGLNSMLQPITDVFDFCDKLLTINGMLRIGETI